MKYSFFSALVVLSFGSLPAKAEHARIDLRIMRVDPDNGETKAEATASADAEPPLGGHTPRPLFKAKVKEPLVLQFIFDNTYPHGLRKNVVVHFFVVREEKARQKELPDLKNGIVIEGKFTMDFKPKCRVGARVAFTVKEPGVYLVRVQTLNTQSDHEHFSALDLQVK